MAAVKTASSRGIILVVDDTPTNIDVLVGILHVEYEYEVRVARSGQQALKVATAATSPDLILLDILMPGMNGYEVCRQLKENKSTKDIPVIFLSAVTEVSERVKAFAAGGVDFISKPFVAAELIARVNTHITLRRLQKNLEYQLDERIAAHQQALEDVQRHREQLVHLTHLNSMSELAASLAHELNQPLTAIVTNAQAAHYFLNSDTQDLDEVKEVLKDISADGLRAAEIIKRTRALMRKGEIARQPTDISEMIRGVVSLLRNEGIRTNTPIYLRIADDLPSFSVDRTQIEQVILNLMLNGLEAMNDIPQKARELVVSAQLTNPGVIEIAVKDAGIGVDEDKLELIFTAFYTTKPHGLGMGLAICKSIVEAHGGRIWVTKNDGPGVTFHIALPLETVAE